MRKDGQVNPTALLLILCAATFMSTLDLFIVNVGLRHQSATEGEREATVDRVEVHRRVQRWRLSKRRRRGS